MSTCPGPFKAGDTGDTNYKVRWSNRAEFGEGHKPPLQGEGEGRGPSPPLQGDCAGARPRRPLRTPCRARDLARAQVRAGREAPNPAVGKRSDFGPGIWGLPGIRVSGSVWAVDYDALRALLEARYLELRRAHPRYGETFRAAWGRARANICEAHGWTVEGFYAELDRRRRPGL